MNLPEAFLAGSYTPVVTPFREGRVDLDKYAELVQWQVEQGSHGIVVCGTTGEPSSLTLEERGELLEVAVDTVSSRIPVVAATGSQSFEETARLTTQAEKAGADALLVVTPYYIRPPQQGLYEYFAAVGRLTSLPLLIYHIPGRAAVALEVATLERIAEATPTLVGIKQAANDLEFVSDVLARLGMEFRVFCGLESLSLPMMTIGAAGLMNAVGNLLPARVAALCDAVRNGDLGEARRLHYELFELNRAIFLSTNPIPLKYMMSRLGLLERPEVRLPLAPIEEDKAAVLDRILLKTGLLEQTPAE